MRDSLTILIASTVILSSSCGNGDDRSGGNADTTAVDTGRDTAATANIMEKGGIKVYEATPSTKFEDAKIKLHQPDLSKPLKAGKNKFTFGVEDYELGMQTPDASHRHMANSHEGQHIHWILNNAPYTAHYDTVIEKDLTLGKHLLLAFLSRSYHESIKTKDAHLLRQLTVAGKDTADFDLNAPYLFYSRPKGEYKGEDTKKLLLDFYLVNTGISENGKKVKAIINGNEFILTKWAPYTIEGLPMGKNTVRIQLVDENGNPVPGPFNDSGERTITLSE